MKNIRPKILFPYFVALIIFLPFSQLAAEFLAYRTVLPAGTIFWLTHWYEPAALVFFAVFLAQAAAAKPNFERSDKVAGLLLSLGFLSVLFSSPSISQGLEGFRFGLFALMVFLIARFSNLSQSQKDSLAGLYLSLSVLLSLWAILERFLPLNYWEIWGLVAPNSRFGFDNFYIVRLDQSVSLIGGPNQLGSYLLPAFFIVLDRLRRQLPMLLFTFNFSLSTFIFTAIFLSFSRSAIVGLLVGIFLYAFWQAKGRGEKLKIAAMAIILIGLGFGLYLTGSQDIQNLFTHGASQSEHASALSLSVQELSNRLSQPAKLLFGSGLGTAGPLAIKYGQGIISESWYFQILFELGLFGLALWLVLIYNLIVRLIKNKPDLAFGLIAISLAALFLHTWADNPALGTTLFLLAGLVYSRADSS